MKSGLRDETDNTIKITRPNFPYVYQALNQLANEVGEGNYDTYALSIEWKQDLPVFDFVLKRMPATSRVKMFNSSEEDAASKRLLANEYCVPQKFFDMLSQFCDNDMG